MSCLSNQFWSNNKNKKKTCKSSFNKLQWIHRNLFICSTPVGFFLFFFFYCKNEKQKTRRQCLLKEEKKNTKRNVECYHWLSGKLNFFFLFFVYCWENSWFCSRWSLGSQFLQRERKKRFLLDWKENIEP